MVQLAEFTQYLDSLLDLGAVPADYSNNGLQIEGKTEVTKAVFSVDASLDLFEKAKQLNADFIFTHHGLSWGSSFKYLTGVTAKRLELLFANGISLYAAHLPLDGHQEIGHNACLAKMLELKNRTMYASYCGMDIGVKGTLESDMLPEQIAAVFDGNLKSSHTIYGPRDRRAKNIGIISGGAGSDGIEQSASAGLDCLVTGEVGHSSYHLIKELGITVISLGHYCSEKPGLFAVMELIQKKFDIKCEFIDIPTGL